MIMLGLMAITGCSLPLKHLTPEEQVKLRAQARWDALIASDLDKAYTYEVPEYRKIYDIKQYKSGINPGLWKKAEVVDVACKEECVVTMRIYVTINFARWGEPADMNSLLKEQWMRDADSGEWFHLSGK